MLTFDLLRLLSVQLYSSYVEASPFPICYRSPSVLRSDTSVINLCNHKYWVEQLTLCLSV